MVTNHQIIGGNEVTYVVVTNIAPPHQIFGDLSAWGEKHKNVSWRAEISRIWSDGRAVLEPSEMPRILPLENGPLKLPAVFFSDNGIVICSSELKNILEEFDPNMHQFIPITVLLSNGEKAPDEHFILYVHHFLDTIIDEKTVSNEFAGTVRDDPTRHLRYVNTGLLKNGDVAVAKSKLTSANLWREKAYPGIYMMSDGLHQRLKENNLQFFKAVKTTEI